MQVNCSFLLHVIRPLPSTLRICCWGIHLQIITDSGEVLSPLLLLLPCSFLMLPYMFLSSLLGSKSSFGEYDIRMKIMKNMLISCPFEIPFTCKGFAYSTLPQSFCTASQTPIKLISSFRIKIKWKLVTLVTSQQLAVVALEWQQELKTINTLYCNCAFSHNLLKRSSVRTKAEQPGL